MRFLAGSFREIPPELAENERIGDVALNVWARSRARNPRPDPVPERPDINVFRQAMRIDYYRDNLPERHQTPDEYVEVPCRIMHTDPSTITLHIGMIRKALGLPPYPLFAREVLNAENRPSATTLANDIEDVDHILSDSD